MQKLDLAAVLSSRICHDLISPVGAIVNGVDLMREIGAGDVDAELQMIGQSAERASCLLQFYRIAFGLAEEDAADLARAGLQTQAEQLVTTSRIRLVWHPLQGPPLARPTARLLYQLLLCARAIVGMSGEIKVSLPPEESLPFDIIISCAEHENKTTLNIDLIDLLSGMPLRDVAPRQVEFALVQSSIEALGLTLTARQTDTGIMISVGTR